VLCCLVNLLRYLPAHRGQGGFPRFYLEGQITMTIESMLTAAVSTLAGAVATLFGLYRRDKLRIEKQLEECNKDRRNLWKELSEIKDFLLEKLQ
jgi:hypothetical protein